MNRKVIILLIASIIANLGLLVATIGGVINNNNKSSQIESLTKENQEINNKLDRYINNEESKTLIENKKIKDNITNFFYAEFNYKNDSYISRFEEVKKYVTEDIYNALKGTGEVTVPKTEFENKVKDLNIYLTTDASNETVKALVTLSTEYSIQGVKTSPVNQIYELELQQKSNENWIITKYTLMGSFAPYSANSQTK